MAELLTAAQMRAIEQAAIDSGEVTGLELMERAGKGVVEAIFEEWPELAEASHRAVVLCGPGNNGGDGFVVARLLKECGWEVEVYYYGNPNSRPSDSEMSYEKWVAVDENWHWSYRGLQEFNIYDIPRADVIIDAMFGTGLTRGLEKSAAKSVATLEKRVAVGEEKVVSVDVPSGLCADSGRGLGTPSTRTGPVIAANLTVSFHSEKLGHRLAERPENCGKVRVVDIGLSCLEGSPRPRVGVKPPPRGADGGCPAVPPGDVVKLVEKPQGLGKNVGTHKFSHGHALILSGGPGKGGAGRLAARGALRIGAGLVTVGPTPGALQENAARLDAVMLSPVKDADSLGVVLQDQRINALCLGPGLGIDRARDLVPVALGAGRATVLDADALTAYCEDPQALFSMLHEGCVLTPHAGEFARLFPDIAAKLAADPVKGPAYSKVDATREAAARAGCVVLFKGADTVIAAPNGRCSVNSAAYERAAPWLATAGAGDVLAGFIAGLLARGLAPMQAAESGAWLHVESALEFGPGLIAEDLPEQLPKVFRKLGV